jgi:hypothetical protein
MVGLYPPSCLLVDFGYHVVQTDTLFYVQVCVVEKEIVCQSCPDWGVVKTEEGAEVGDLEDLLRGLDVDDLWSDVVVQSFSYALTFKFY